jgi:acyl carrier protein
MTGDVEIGRRARVIIARELGCSLRLLTDSADFRADLGADSLDLVNVPRALENEFDILLTDDEVEFCQTVGTAIDVIRSKLENGAQFDRRRAGAGLCGAPIQASRGAR